MNGDTIYHLTIKDANTHHYFGSISAIFDVFTPTDIGVSKTRLWGFKLAENKPYENKLIILRKGNLHRKSSYRGQKLNR